MQSPRCHSPRDVHLLYRVHGTTGLAIDSTRTQHVSQRPADQVSTRAGKSLRANYMSYVQHIDRADVLRHETGELRVKLARAHKVFV
jgi:hypothetical protein